MGLHDRLHRQNGSPNGHGPELDMLAGLPTRTQS
jgi:hypothetical protein